MSACNSTVVGGGGTDGGILEFQSTPLYNLHGSEESKGKILMTNFFYDKYSVYNSKTSKGSYWAGAREKNNNKSLEETERQDLR